MRRMRNLRKNYYGYIFLAPFLVFFSIFMLVPLGYSFIISLFRFNGIETAKFVGLENFRFLLIDDTVFPLALKNTFMFAVFIGPLGFIFSFLVAVYINNLKFKNAFALAFYAPSITSGIAMTVIWMYFFSNDRFGLINHLLLKFGIINDPLLWSRNPVYIFPLVILITVWMGMGTGFLAFLAGLQNMPSELYEQGRIDGIKGPIQELRHITIPLMKPQLLFGSINAIVGSFSVFDIGMQFAGFPSPNYAAHTLVGHSYDYAFVRFEFGYSAAVATVLFIITFSLGRIAMRVFRSGE